MLLLIKDDATNYQRECCCSSKMMLPTQDDATNDRRRCCCLSKMMLLMSIKYGSINIQASTIKYDSIWKKMTPLKLLISTTNADTVSIKDNATKEI